MVLATTQIIGLLCWSETITTHYPNEIKIVTRNVLSKITVFFSKVNKEITYDNFTSKLNSYLIYVSDIMCTRKTWAHIIKLYTPTRKMFRLRDPPKVISWLDFRSCSVKPANSIFSARYFCITNIVSIRMCNYSPL